MFRPLSLLLLVAALAGCQSITRPADYDSSLVSVRCMLFAGKKPFDPDNLRYIERFADYGNASCKAWLGKLYQEGGHGVDQDFNQARALFVESARVNPSSNILLGQMAERGEGEPVDYAKAREFYRLSGSNAVLPLGRLMEEGKGGPKDPKGAMALYLASSERYHDNPWEAMIRLHNQGLAFDEAQAKRYQQLWLAGFVREQNRRMAVREVFDAVNASGAAKGVRLSYRFKADSGTPQVTLVTSSGDGNVDSWVMKAAARISMGDSPPQTDASGVQEVVAPLMFSPQDTARMQSICGRKPCTQ